MVPFERQWTYMQKIVIIEDDNDDQEIMRLTLSDLGVRHEIVFFNEAQSAFTYLSDEKVIPLIIFSDINMPGMNGFQLRDKIHADPDLRIKCTPYIFLTTGGETRHIWEAYTKNAQGFFVKPSSLSEWKDLFSLVLDYWASSKKPHA